MSIVGAGREANSGVLSLNDIVLSGNTVRGGAGGNGSSVKRSSPQTTGYGGIGGNGGSAEGGAIYNKGTLTLTDTHLQGNSAIGGQGGNGGAGYMRDFGGGPAKWSQSRGGSGGTARGGGIYNAGQFSQITTIFEGENIAVAGSGGNVSGANGTAEGNDIYDANNILLTTDDVTFNTTQWSEFQAQLIANGRGLPLTYSLVSGNLPKGMSLDSKTGIISGQATISGSGLKVSYQITSGSKSSNVATITFNITPLDRSSLIVNTTEDSSENDGKTSLREAIAFANSIQGTGSRVISFDLPTGTPQTITLTQGTLSLTSSTSIEWKGDAPLTIVCGGTSFAIRQNTASLSGLTITGATTNQAVYIAENGTLNMSNCVLRDNKVTQPYVPTAYGGAILNSGVLNLSNCTISGNSSQSFGGGIANNNGAATIANCTICNNSAPYGGGIAGIGSVLSTILVVNSTICNNSSAHGGGIYNASTLRVDSCTLTGNSSTDTPGGGIEDSYNTSIKNSILVANTPGNYSKSGSETNSATNSLVGGTYAGAGLDPRGLQDNDGATPTIALIVGSPAIDAGSTTLPTDQRGIARPQGSAPDIGAFEVMPLPTPTPLPTATPTSVPTATPQPIETPKPTATATPIPTNTPLPTATPTPKPTATVRPVPTPTSTPAPAATPKPTSPPKPTSTPKPRPTATPAPLPLVSVNSPSVTEGDSGTTRVLFTLTLNKANPKGARVYVNTLQGTASANSDYVPLNKTLVTFGPGVMVQTVAVSVRGDTVDENDEKFALVLSSPTGATLGNGRGTCTIVDDDGAPTLSINDISLTEGNSGTKKATFTLILSSLSGKEVSLNYATQDRSASAGSDYLNLGGTLTFAPGEKSKTVSVTIKGDISIEKDEQFALMLSRPVNVTFAKSSATCTIQNDDGAQTRASPPTPSGSAPMS